MLADIFALVNWVDLPTFLEAASPAAETVAVAGEAALEAVAANAALLLGAGVLGWEIGHWLQKTFAPETPTEFPAIGGVLGGGQAGIIYHVTFEYETISGGPATQSVNLEGPIIGFVQGDQIQGTPSMAHYWWIYYGPSQQQYGPGLVDDDIIVFPHITGFTPLTTPSKPDPHQPWTYPPAAPDLPKLNPTKPFPFLPGTPNLPMEIVPFKRPRRNPGVTPLQPGESEQPGVLVKIPDLGTGIEFTPDGVDVKTYNPLPVPQPDTQKDTRVPPPPSLPPICDCPCDDSEILSKLKEIKDEEDEIKKLVTPPEYDYTSEIVASGGGANVDLPEGTYAVEILITGHRLNEKKQAGNGGPDVYYQGWYSFGGADSDGGNRLPISYGKQYVTVPDLYTKFSFTVYTGLTGTATALIRHKRDT